MKIGQRLETMPAQNQNDQIYFMLANNSFYLINIVAWVSLIHNHNMERSATCTVEGHGMILIFKK